MIEGGDNKEEQKYEKISKETGGAKKKEEVSVFKEAKVLHDRIP